jgi:sugar (pentulose or hexulose) kinase
MFFSTMQQSYWTAGQEGLTMPKLIGVDIGTTGTKAILIDADGKLISESYQGTTLRSELPGRVEQDANDWWEAVISTIRNCIKGEDNKEDIVAIALSSQGGSMVPVDVKGNPLSNAVIWMDRRGQKQTEDLISAKPENFYYERTGWRLANCLNLVQMKWLKDNNPELFKHSDRFLSTVDFVNHKLTGTYAIDPSNAGMTQLFNILDKKWEREILCDLEIQENRLAEIVESGDAIGKLTAEAALGLGLPEKTLVVSGGHDQYCAALGAGVFNHGDILLSTGTAWVLMGIFDHPVFDTKAFFAPGNHVVKGKWGAIGTVPTAGVALEWYRSNVGLFPDAETPESFEEIDKKALLKKPGAGGVMFYPHFTGSSCPEWNFKNKATILGLELGHDRYDIARAVMEGVVYDVYRMLKAFERQNENVDMLKALGGAAKSALWMGILADVTGLPVYIPAEGNSACFGAAILAGKGTGVFDSMQEGYQRIARKDKEILPDRENHKIYSQLFDLYNNRFEYLKCCYEL